MEAKYYSETSIDFHQFTRCYIPENRVLHYHGCENLKSYNFCADYQHLTASKSVEHFCKLNKQVGEGREAMDTTPKWRVHFKHSYYVELSNL
jgi:hypothetical protein